MGQVEVLRAPAKLTRSLRLVGVRPDGYHLIEAEMVTLDLADRLLVAEGDGLVVEGPFADQVPTGEDNLVRRALAAVGRRAAVVLDKRIPPGAGLGGGSADAAAVLRWAGCSDTRIAAQIGSDVPFCLVGGRARVGGAGERIWPLEPLSTCYLVLVPPTRLDTASVYRAWDRLGGPEGANGNDLEPAALALAPELAVWRDRLGELTGLTPRLAGSGSAWFVERPEPFSALAGELMHDGQKGHLLACRACG